MNPTLKIGILSHAEYRQRMLAIARGEHRPQADEPKIWFESLQAVAQILNSDNQALLRLIQEKHPHSMKELAELSGRKPEALSRTLKTLEKYGIVELKREHNGLKAEVKASRFQVEFGLS